MRCSPILQEGQRHATQKIMIEDTMKAKSQDIMGTRDEQGPWEAFSGTKDESVMAKWCLKTRVHEQSTAVSPCLGQ